jgi:hypothetical protein
MSPVFAARQGQPVPKGYFEGVPSHLRSQLERWLRNVYVIEDNQFYAVVDETALDRVAAILRIDLTGATGDEKLSLVLKWASDDERFLDFVHYTLQLSSRLPNKPKELSILLALGGSVWRATENGLERRVDAVALQSFNVASAAHDSASDHLQQGWTKAYGREPDASDAWDHSIKAVETILIPVVVPKQDQPQLGHVIGQLERQGRLFQLGLPGPGNDHSVDVLVKMLRSLWPNPDWHGDPNGQRRTPSLDEARAVVQLAVAIVQWARDGQIVRR